jgi:hypothetical protein
MCLNLFNAMYHFFLNSYFLTRSELSGKDAFGDSFVADLVTDLDDVTVFKLLRYLEGDSDENFTVFDIDFCNSASTS